MRRIFTVILLLGFLIVPVHASELTPPTVPEHVADLMPQEPETFAEGLWFVIRHAAAELEPALAQAARNCLAITAAVLLTSTLHLFSGEKKHVANLVCTLVISTILLGPASTLIRMGMETVSSLSEYGKLLLPVMTAALAAQGGAVTSAALYTGTMVFDTVLGDILTKLLVPTVSAYLALAVANSAMKEDVLKRLRDFAKWLMTWILKTVIYVYMAYMGVTGVISGSADASALKMTKIAISGMVPVVGGMLADASETILISAGLVKNAVGVYGLLAVLAIWIRPFLRIGVQYLLLKLTAAVCSVYGTEDSSGLIQDFSAAMGLLLAATGTMCLLLLISTICFVKGAG